MVNNDWGSIYKELGAKPIINAMGSVTLIGGSTPIPEVQEAMNRASDAYIPLMELQEKAGGFLADIIGVPAAYITSGAGSALTLAAAACMAGNDDEKIQQLPDTTGMKNEILIQERQRYWYDRCLEIAGAKLVRFGTKEKTTKEDLEKAIGPNTCAVHYFAQEQIKDDNLLSLEDIIEIAHSKGVYVTVDAAGQVYPLALFGKFVKMGADFQCIAAKYLGASQSSGLALGTEELISKIAKQSFVGYEGRRIRGIGRPHKVDRQEMLGVVAAVKYWLSCNHEERLSKAESQSQTIASALDGIAGVDAKVINNVMGHQPFGLELTIDESIHGFNNEVLVQKLKEGDPPIWTRVPDGAEYVSIHVFGLSDGEPEIVGKRLADLLT